MPDEVLVSGGLAKVRFESDGAAAYVARLRDAEQIAWNVG